MNSSGPGCAAAGSPSGYWAILTPSRCDGTTRSVISRFVSRTPMATNDLYSMELAPTQIAGYLVMVIFCVFPPLMLLMSGIGFGPSPILTILVTSAVGGTVTAVLMNWPSNKSLAAFSGFVGGVGAQLLLFECISWFADVRVPKVMFALALAGGAAPGYLLFRWFRVTKPRTGTKTS